MDPDNIPETMEIMGVTLGSIYNRDALSVDIYDQMKKYSKKVLIIHGTKDSLVPIVYSERAVETFPDAELVRFDGAEHGLLHNDIALPFDRAIRYSGDYSHPSIAIVLASGIFSASFLGRLSLRTPSSNLALTSVSVSSSPT